MTRSRRRNEDVAARQAARSGGGGRGGEEYRVQRRILLFTVAFIMCFLVFASIVCNVLMIA
jgi:hypothetical protein